MYEKNTNVSEYLYGSNLITGKKPNVFFVSNRITGRKPKPQRTTDSLRVAVPVGVTMRTR